MLTWLPSSVGARLLRCFAILTLGIRRRAAVIRCHETELLAQLCCVWLFQVDIAIMFQTTWRDNVKLKAA